MKPADEFPESEHPATIKMPTPPDLSQRQKAASEEITAGLRAAGFLPENGTATVISDEHGRITSIEFSEVTYDHAMNFARRLTAPRVHDPEKPGNPPASEKATFEGLSPFGLLDREREKTDKARKPRISPATPKAR